MTDALRKDPKLIRSSILYEFLRGEPAFDTYKNVCKVMGEDVIEYREFEFWYMKFARGNYDFTSDDSSQPNNLFLMDLPIEIIDKIVTKTSWDGVIALRQVSQNLRTIVNNTKIVYKEVNVLMEEFSTTLSIDGESSVYKRLPIHYNDSDAVKRHKNSDYHAFRKLIFLMKNSRIQVEKLYVDDQIDWEATYEKEYGRGFDYPHCQLMLKEAKLHVRTVFLCSTFHNTNFIMRALKPGTLEQIKFIEDVEVVFREDTPELDQWKMAKILEITGYQRLKVPFEHFVNFARFDIEMYNFTVRKLVELNNTVLKSSNFEKCHLDWLAFEVDTDDGDADDNDDDEEIGILDCIERGLGPHTRKDSKNPNYRHYVIEYENKVFELKTKQHSIEIERKR